MRPAEKVLTVGVDESPPPPLCFGLPDGPDFRGFGVDLLRAIASKLGMTLRCKSALWSAAIAALEGGRFDMLCTAATITPQRRQVVDFSDPYFDAGLVLVVRHDIPIVSVNGLAGQTIGVRVATVAEEFVRQRCHPAAVCTFDLNVDAYQALGDRRVDAVVDDGPIGTFFARSREGFQVVPLAGTGFQYGMAFAKGNDRLRGAVNQALAELRADGTWERFYRRWFEEGQAP